MIYTDSRYATGSINYINDARLNKNQLSVYRSFPTLVTNFLAYTWTDNDRIDVVAAEFLGSSTLWWKIMDVNPEVANPFSITPGTVIRIPSA